MINFTPPDVYTLAWEDLGYDHERARIGSISLVVWVSTDGRWNAQISNPIESIQRMIDESWPKPVILNSHANARIAAHGRAVRLIQDLINALEGA